MPGTVTVRPLSAKLKRDTELFGTMDPYCKITLGKQKVQGQVCQNGGKHPHWDETLTLRRNGEPTCQIELKEKDWLLPDSLIGYCDINLIEVEAAGRVLKWYNVIYQNQQIGQLLVESTYEPDQPKVLKEAPPVILAPLPMEKGRQGQVVQSGQPVQEKKGLLSGIIHGWNPFKGSSSQRMEENYNNKEQIQGPPQQIPIQRAQESYPPKGQFVPELSQQQMKSENIEQQQSIYAPPISELQASQEYPQKYPQFDSQQYPYYNEENREGMGYQGSNSDYAVNQQPQHNRNVGGYDPLSVIRGNR